MSNFNASMQAAIFLAASSARKLIPRKRRRRRNAEATLGTAAEFASHGHSPAPSDYYDSELESESVWSHVQDEDPDLGPWGNRKRAVFRVFDEPLSSPLALVVNGLILILIVMSTITFMLETLPENRDDDEPWFTIESIAVGLFTLEFLIRLATCPSLASFVKGPLNIVDLLAILPYYLDLALSGTGVSGLIVIRVVRLARVFRIFKVSRYSTGLLLVTKAMRRSLDALGLLLFLVIIAMVLFSSFVYLAEQSRSDWDDDLNQFVYNDGSINPYRSIPESFWWTVVTLTTVGYGDFAPRTPVGRFVGMIAMLSGIIIIAFPMAVIGANFSEVWVEQKERKARKAARKRARELAEKGQEPLSPRAEAPTNTPPGNTLEPHLLPTYVKKLSRRLVELSNYANGLQATLQGSMDNYIAVRKILRQVRQITFPVASRPRSHSISVSRTSAKDILDKLTDDMPAATIFHLMASQINQPASAVDPYIQRLARYSLVTVEDLRMLTAEEWRSLDLPVYLQVRIERLLLHKSLIPADSMQSAELLPRSRSDDNLSRQSRSSL